MSVAVARFVHVILLYIKLQVPHTLLRHSKYEMHTLELSRRVCAGLRDLATSLQQSLILLLSYPLGKAHNIRAFRFNIPWVVKVTERSHNTEAHALRYLHSTGLDLPIPRLVFSCVHRGVTYTIMTRVPGTNMKEALMRGDLAPNTVEVVAQEVADVLNKLRTLRQPPADAGKVMMSASGHDLPDPVTFFEERSGPYPSIIELWMHCGSFRDLDEMREYVEPTTFDILAADPIHYVHPDLRTYNVIIRDGHLSGIVDWEDSGWFPSSWQVHTMRWLRFGCDGPWYQYWLKHRFPEEAEAAYAASKTFLIKSPV
ncbi:kinase-like domain-containing protein [Cubamyces lactineus]|nr:kinase-like domain-containing protein [Cubamyces lactineus]